MYGSLRTNGEISNKEISTLDKKSFASFDVAYGSKQFRLIVDQWFDHVKVGYNHY